MASANASYGNTAQPQANKSARSSFSSTASSTSPAARKSTWQRFLNGFKPVEEAQTPISIFGPGYYQASKMNAKSSGQQKERQNSSRRASELYQGFKTKVGGEKVNFYG